MAGHAAAPISAAKSVGTEQHDVSAPQRAAASRDPLRVPVLLDSGDDADISADSRSSPVHLASAPWKRSSLLAVRKRRLLVDQASDVPPGNVVLPVMRGRRALNLRVGGGGDRMTAARATAGSRRAVLSGGRPASWRRMSRAHLAAERAAARSALRGRWRPHAGYVYSGGVAGKVFARDGGPAARGGAGAQPHRARRARGACGRAARSRCRAARCPSTRSCARAASPRRSGSEADHEAHRLEHALEVELPFLRARRPDADRDAGDPRRARRRRVRRARAGAGARGRLRSARRCWWSPRAT